MLTPLIRPRRLKQGARVVLVAPSGGADRLRLDRGMRLLAELGMDVCTTSTQRSEDGYFAASDEQRAEDFTAAWCDPDNDAVFCVRGGWGAARMVGLLDWEAMAARNAASGPPVFLGCSDITTLHTAIAQRLGVATLFGPMAATDLFAEGEPEPASLRHLVATLAEPEKVQRLGGFGVRALCPGTARGVTTGGTLTILAASLGTPDAFAAPGGVLLLEDVNEEWYRIDRALTQLLRSGALDGLAAVVCGDWTACGPDNEIDALLVERLGPLGIPVLAGLSVGHGPVQTTFPLGVEVVVDGAAGTVELVEPALS